MNKINKIEKWNKRKTKLNKMYKKTEKILIIIRIKNEIKRKNKYFKYAFEMTNLNNKLVTKKI